MSVIFFMRTIFDYPAFNPPFQPIRSAFSPFSRRSRARAALSLQSTFYFSCWTALGYEELLSTIYLIPYSIDYSSYFSPFVLGAHHAQFSCIREPQLSSSSPPSLRPFVPARAGVPYFTPPNDTYIPQLVCYADRKRPAFVELYCLLRAHPFLPHFSLLSPPNAVVRSSSRQGSCDDALERGVPGLIPITSARERRCPDDCRATPFAMFLSFFPFGSDGLIAADGRSFHCCE